MHAASTTVSGTCLGGISETHDGCKGPHPSRGSTAHSSFWVWPRPVGPGAGSNETSSPTLTRLQDVLGVPAKHDTTQTPRRNPTTAPRSMSRG
uniref:Uncharacterized protein n=1 Tax=Human herpesvirus 1 TaxID=10298 RepID=A0A2Z4H8S1_HHV1|nr:hypothetical protein [Human alphaherpesvirus 1]